MEILSGFFQSVLGVIGATWWIFLPIILFLNLKNVWLIYIHDRTVKEIEWITLEIKVPKDLLTTPKAMEQVFASMYGDYSHGFNYIQKYIDGDIDYWYSFEIVGYAGGVHFYVHIPKKMRNLVESAIYAQYPESEISETEDYTLLLPNALPNKNYNLWGTDLILGRESCYPLRTYPFFEESQEEKRLDPIAALTEVMSNLKGDERIWFQVIVSPSDNSPRIENKWKQEGETTIKEVTTGKKPEKPKGFFADIGEFFKNLTLAPAEYPLWGPGEIKRDPSAIKFLSPAEQEVVKAIDGKISKLGFETTIRFLYIDKRESFSSANATAVMGTVRQFNTQNLNFFKPDKKTITLVTGWKPKFIPLYKKLNDFSRKKKVYTNYKRRKLGGRMIGLYRGEIKKFPTFSTEELATLYHYPLMMVGAPKLRRLESKKGEPPAGLPTIE